MIRFLSAVTGLLLVVSILAPANVRAESTRRDKVFVSPVHGADLRPGVSEALTDLVVVAVTRTRSVDIVTVEDVKAQLQQEKLKDALNCTSISCAAELAGALDVRYLLATRARKLGSRVLITMSLIDTRDQKSLNGQGECPDNEDEYRLAVEAATTEVFSLANLNANSGSVAVQQPLSSEQPAVQARKRQDTTAQEASSADYGFGAGVSVGGAYSENLGIEAHYWLLDELSLDASLSIRPGRFLYFVGTFGSTYMLGYGPGTPRHSVLFQIAGGGAWDEYPEYEGTLLRLGTGYGFHSSVLGVRLVPCYELYRVYHRWSDGDPYWYHYFGARLTVSWLSTN